MSTTIFVDFYSILQVGQTSDEKEITAAIREQRRRWAKRSAQADPKRRAEAEERMRHIDEAERVLKNKDLRRQFDVALENYRPPTPHAAEADGQRDWLHLSREYLDASNPYSANYAAREAINIHGSSHEAWYIRAHSSFLLGKPADAEYEFNEAIRLKPDQPDYHFDLAEAYADQGKWKSALGEYEASMTLQPGNPVYKTAIANVYLNNNQPKRALELMEDVIAAHPDQHVFDFYLAWALHDFCLTQWATLKGNARWAITSPAQIEYTERSMNRAMALKFDEPQLRASIKENLELAAKAKELKWVHSANMMWYLGGWGVSLLLISARGIGLIPLGLITWAYVARHRKPEWKHRAAAVHGRLESPGLQGDSVPDGMLGLGSTSSRRSSAAGSASDSSSGSSGAGWHPDPENDGEEVYWDGSAWTDRRAAS